jgi:hypothetical protein
VKRVIEITIAGDYGQKVHLRAVVDGVTWSDSMRKIQDELTARLMQAVTGLPIINVPLGRVRVK